MQSHKVARHTKHTSKNKTKNRVILSAQCVTIREDVRGGFVPPLKQCVESITFFMRGSLFAHGKASIMDAKFSHVRVSFPPITQAQKLQQRAIDWQSMESADPVIVSSDPLPSDLSPDHPVYLVRVPASFEPQSWRTIPPGANSYPTSRSAAEIVALLNLEKIRTSEDGTVRSWFIRLRRSNGGASICINLKGPWKPKDQHDTPPAFMVVKGRETQWRDTIAELNEGLRGAADGRGYYWRAYVAYSTRIEDVTEWIKPYPQEASQQTCSYLTSVYN